MGVAIGKFPTKDSDGIVIVLDGGLVRVFDGHENVRTESFKEMSLSMGCIEQ